MWDSPAFGFDKKYLLYLVLVQYIGSIVFAVTGHMGGRKVVGAALVGWPCFCLARKLFCNETLGISGRSNGNPFCLYLHSFANIQDFVLPL